MHCGKQKTGYWINSCLGSNFTPIVNKQRWAASTSVTMAYITCGFVATVSFTDLNDHVFLSAYFLAEWAETQLSTCIKI